MIFLVCMVYVRVIVDQISPLKRKASLMDDCAVVDSKKPSWNTKGLNHKNIIKQL